MWPIIFQNLYFIHHLSILLCIISTLRIKNISVTVFVSNLLMTLQNP